jgi:hypothetical protein
LIRWAEDRSKDIGEEDGFLHTAAAVARSGENTLLCCTLQQQRWPTPYSSMHCLPYTLQQQQHALVCTAWFARHGIARHGVLDARNDSMSKAAAAVRTLGRRMASCTRQQQWHAVVRIHRLLHLTTTAAEAAAVAYSNSSSSMMQWFARHIVLDAHTQLVP